MCEFVFQQLTRKYGNRSYLCQAQNSHYNYYVKKYMDFITFYGTIDFALIICNGHHYFYLG